MKHLEVLGRYPITLFNELYYLNAGGTIWTGFNFSRNLLEGEFS